MMDVLCNPYNVILLAGKRLRMVKIEDIGEVTINDPENHGVPIVCAPQWQIAKTVAAYEGTYGLIWRRHWRLQLLVDLMYKMPGHE